MQPAPTGRNKRARSIAPGGLRAAVQLLTILPAGKPPACPEELGRSVAYFPVVGLLLGWVLAWLGWLAGRLWPAGISAGLVLAAWIVLTGALHMDGLLDACDGLFGGRTVEDRLRILRDEHVGAYAVLGGVLVVLIDQAALAAIPEPAPALLLAPVIGRWSMVLAVVLFPYARPSGLGRAVKDHAGPASVVLATAFTLGCAWLVDGWRGIDCVALALAVVAVVSRLVAWRLPGWTGDLYGAVCVLVEMMVLLVHAVRPAS